MSGKAKADGGGPPVDQSDDRVESWLREAARAPVPARVPDPGEIVGGKYRIEELLGRGGMGVVFRAQHVVSEKPVAIKWMLRPATDEQARKRFDREARAAGRIDHPNVVTLYDVGEEGDCSYLVMELLRGESLRERLRGGPLDPMTAVTLLVPAMRGVAAAHRAGVVHRDLKPDNIFLCEAREDGQREVKVLDFGVSSIVSLEAADSTLTQEGTLLGSLAYMSPEQLRNPHDVDARTDVYAFGVILYELLTGHLPFEGVNHSALIVAITTAVPRRPSQMLTNLPAGLEEVVMRALSRDREDRYPGMNSLIDALLPHAMVVPGPHAPRESGVPQERASGGQPRGGVATASEFARGASMKSAEAVVPMQRLGGSLGARVGWVAAAVLLLLVALWAVSGREQPTASAPAATPSVVPDAPAIGTAPSPAPAAAAAAAPASALPPPLPAAAPAPPTTAPMTAVAAPAPARAPARAPRTAKAARRVEAAAPHAAPADEAALFSGRK